MYTTVLYIAEIRNREDGVRVGRGMWGGGWRGDGGSRGKA
jgi:hypothetical protein